MNNKPVAWIEPDVIPLTHIIKAVVRRERDEQYSIPLYTHPADLTDEEIEEFAYAFQLWQLHNPDKALEGIMDFARAILRKAQEK